ncbi:MAG: hypothetical protein H0V17_13655, partial [Deltaproteobacteria bacterium]|nr:hypothetical protein [Deltaproteobacteria bacterium]
MRLFLVVMALASVTFPRLADAEDPVTSRLLTAPTAWLPPANGVVVTTTLDHRFDGSAVVGYGLGGVGAIDVGTDTDVRSCATCDGDAEPIFLGRAGFRMGLGQDTLFRGMPAVLVGVRTTFASSGSARVRVSEAYAVASRELGPLVFHGGAQAVDASADGDELGVTIKLIAGLEWTPGQYPNTTVIADFAHVPLIRTSTGPALEWVAGVGVRYLAFRDWGAIELGVRVREDEGLGDTTVMIRLNGVFDP